MSSPVMDEDACEFRPCTPTWPEAPVGLAGTHMWARARDGVMANEARTEVTRYLACRTCGLVKATIFDWPLTMQAPRIKYYHRFTGPPVHWPGVSSPG